MGTVPVPAVGRAGRARRAEQERLRARRSRDAVPATAGRAFEEHVAGPRRRDGCTDVRGIGGAGGPEADVTGTLPDGRGPTVRCGRCAPYRSAGSRDLQTFNGTARPEHGADVPVSVASRAFTAPARAFAARHALGLGGIDLLGFWNGGTPLSSFLDLDIARSGTPRRLPRKR